MGWNRASILVVAFGSLFVILAVVGFLLPQHSTVQYVAFMKADKRIDASMFWAYEDEDAWNDAEVGHKKQRKEHKERKYLSIAAWVSEACGPIYEALGATFCTSYQSFHYSVWVHLCGTLLAIGLQVGGMFNLSTYLDPDKSSENKWHSTITCFAVGFAVYLVTLTVFSMWGLWGLSNQSAGVAAVAKSHSSGPGIKIGALIFIVAILIYLLQIVFLTCGVRREDDEEIREVQMARDEAAKELGYGSFNQIGNSTLCKLRMKRVVGKGAKSMEGYKLGPAW